MLNAILVDDEESNLNALKEKLLRHCHNLNLAALCTTAADALVAIEAIRPDVVFLDIEMPVMNGFLLLQNLRYKNFELIFTTAYDHYAIKAIRFSALDYLVKPIEIEDLKAAVSRAEEKRAQVNSANQLDIFLENLSKKTSHQKIAIPTAEGLQFIKLSGIVYLEASINYTYVFLDNNQKYLVSRTLKEFEDMLPPETFVRIHNSHIINKDFAEKYIRGEGGQVVLSSGVVLGISKRRKAEFLKAIGS
ncbi:LytR/AlgR family response regulator transcription factor [Flavisolibacter ginsenosidimutans]|uniref:Response regulator transcription factor n=1 Tax=Flavisolibacter ginsenosidimutans TaxID=661481 RepID=A0A5B8UDJ1_9BACT|nr:LytTR family DNA-binding domain-containing protein [Flavisolibacter ginsenosidimutans]QEC54578.1 response regulator transcription factor [Flavisolibacter ginsenosidimutans]